MTRLNDVWAYVVEIDDEERVIGRLEGNGWVPFITTDPLRVAAWRPHAIEFAKLDGNPVRLIKFSSRSLVETLRS